MICSEPVCSFLRVCGNIETNSVAISGATYLNISQCNCNSCGQDRERGIKHVAVVAAAALIGSLFSMAALLPGL